MPDAGERRFGDDKADTLGSIFRWTADVRGEPLQIPNLAALGLEILRPDLKLSRDKDTIKALSGYQATAYRAALGYPGADTFAGHQTMMGADMSHVVDCLLSERLTEVSQVLEHGGYRTQQLNGEPIILVDDAILVHDNLEADPALIWNVSARLTEVPWETILDIAKLVRNVAPVSRVIAVGGYSDQPLYKHVRLGDGGAIGLDTPASGFYTNGGLQVEHLGAALDHTKQLPELAAQAGFRVTLIGKAADILVTDTTVHRHPAVNTAEVLQRTISAQQKGGLIVANVQETDLAGHQQDPARFALLLEQVDKAIPQLLAGLTAADLLVITADHGNDPLIGHAYHTREYAPVLIVRQSATPNSLPSVKSGGTLATLADVGAIVETHLGILPHDIQQSTPMG